MGKGGEPQPICYPHNNNNKQPPFCKKKPLHSVHRQKEKPTGATQLQRID